MAKERLIIWDCDGTLAKSDVPLNLALLRALKVYGIPEFINLDYLNHDCIGLAIPDLIKKIAEDSRIDIPLSVMDEYLVFVPDLLNQHLQVDPDAVRVLFELHNIYDMAVGSNGRTFNVEKTIEAVGLSPVFHKSVIYTPEKAGLSRGKPAPDLFMHIAQDRGYESRDATVFEDSPTGARAGFSANMHVIGTTIYSDHPNDLEAKLRAEGVVQIARSWDQIRELALTRAV
ncbi:MAG: hypothetical protein AUJ12_03885 [Alphaproteobacteria bacterium CG1_02_46_17]|nr:MAG: hypothetical protein AUJ12_03885 [Alphaproteobacteria bacterium CG1_02_46_17]